MHKIIFWTVLRMEKNIARAVVSIIFSVYKITHVGDTNTHTPQLPLLPWNSMINVYSWLEPQRDSSADNGQV